VAAVLAGGDVVSRYLHQIVFCCDRKGRAYRREITVSGKSAMVTNVEVLPPHYDIAMERMRREDEEIAVYEGTITYWSGYQGCPLCGNRGVFICGCGYLSCVNTEKRPVHTCPRCEGIFNVVDAKYVPMSESGLVHGKNTKELPRQARPPERPVPGSPDREKEDVRAKLQKFLAGQAKKQLEDKRDGK
jgi:hypothetical protein